MMKRANQILNTVIGVCVGIWIGHGLYTFWDFKSHPNVYAVQSAPWYTSVILYGVITAIVVATAFVIKWILKKMR